MSQPTPNPLSRSLRIRAAEVKRRLETDEPVRFLDARSEKAWQATAAKIRGAVRIRPLLFTIDPDWDPAHLTVVYCA
jgi:hypothetical protein